MKAKIYEDKKVAVIGFGVTGQAATRHLISSGNEVHVFDRRPQNDFDDAILKKFPSAQFHFEIIDDDAIQVEQFDYIVASPGIHTDQGPVARAIFAGIPVYNDVTLFIKKWREVGPIVGVTGSNGKTTTVSLLNECLHRRIPSIIAGNIGQSPLDLLGIQYPQGAVAILELSSYQLELFKSEDYLDVCVVTNLGSNHLDRYGGDMRKYASAKLLGINPEKTKVIVTSDDFGTQKHISPQLRQSLKNGNVIDVSFENDFRPSVCPGIFLDDEGDLIYYDPSSAGRGVGVKNFSDGNVDKNVDGKVEKVLPNPDDRRLIGIHNLYNIGFALAVIRSLGLSIDEETREIARNFVGLEHRIEFVREIDHVKYINDSKSTSPDSTQSALRSVGVPKRTILIAGGGDKDMNFSMLEDVFNDYLKMAILLPGSASEKIREIIKNISGVGLVTASDMIDAVRVAKNEAEAGDVIILSPGATSFENGYKDFEDRGSHFKQIVNTILL